MLYYICKKTTGIAEQLGALWTVVYTVYHSKLVALKSNFNNGFVQFSKN